MNSRTIAFGIGTALVGLCFGLTISQPASHAKPLPTNQTSSQLGRFHPTTGDVRSMFITDTTTGQTWYWNGDHWRTLPKPS